MSAVMWLAVPVLMILTVGVGRALIGWATEA